LFDDQRLRLAAVSTWMPAEQHEGNLFFEQKKASPPGARAFDRVALQGGARSNLKPLA
jgi:hypothetical protein